MDTELQEISQEEFSSEKTNCEVEDNDTDNTIHGFNMSNITVVEKTLDETTLDNYSIIKPASYEGSDSGVEVIENCFLKRTSSMNSSNSQEFPTTTTTPYESSIISCCSNYEEAYNILARRNSTLLENYNIRSCDGTSEGGSESSSVVGSSSSRTRSLNSTKKKSATSDVRARNTSVQKSRSRPPITLAPKNSPTNITDHEKINKTQSCKTPRKAPSNLVLITSKSDSKKKPSTSRASSSTRTPATTPTDDGRWPSINSKPAPLMGRSARGFPAPEQITKRSTSQTDTKFSSIEKYATLPRRRKEKSVNSTQDIPNKSNCTGPKEVLFNRANVIKRAPSRDTPKTMPIPPKKKNSSKVKIYHEISSQTAMTQIDIENAFSGIHCIPPRPQDVEKIEKGAQVEMNVETVEKLNDEIKILRECHDKLLGDYKKQSENVTGLEQRLEEEKNKKLSLKEELRQNTERVLAILGNDDTLPDVENCSSNSLLLLESRYNNVGQIVIKQEKEISDLNKYLRSLQRDFDKSEANRTTLIQQQLDLEAETMELQEFMQAEKSTLADSLKEAESEIKKFKFQLAQKQREIECKQDESRILVRVSEQRKQENIGLLARLGLVEVQSKDVLIFQGGLISSTSVALAALISRLNSLVDELVASYDISESELEDVIFHNEAYTNSSSSPDATPEKSRNVFKDVPTTPPRRSSFVSAIINAIKNATTQKQCLVTKDNSKDTISLDSNSYSTEMLDSETEPCLMMEPVLEDAVILDGYTHNMISSGHGSLCTTRLTRSESVNNILQRTYSEQNTMSESMNATLLSETTQSYFEFPTVPLIDQVIEVDNLITRLLKVLRIIQIENEDYINELQEEKENLSIQVKTKNDANKVVAKQLMDWEVLGAHLKSEVTELMQQLGRKNKEIDDYKTEINQHRKEVQRLNEDVCALSTACSKSELELKIVQDEATEFIKKWQETGEIPSKDILSKLFLAQKEILLLKEKMEEKDKQLTELKLEFLDSRHVLSENWKEAIGEAKKQYHAIDSALEILNSIQTVVQQCPPLAQLQRDLEATSFQTASSMPITASDLNTNSGLLKTVNNMEILSPINSTA